MHSPSSEFVSVIAFQTSVTGSWHSCACPLQGFRDIWPLLKYIANALSLVSVFRKKLLGNQSRGDLSSLWKINANGQIIGSANRNYEPYIRIRSYNNNNLVTYLKFSIFLKCNFTELINIILQNLYLYFLVFSSIIFIIF